jgi:hypothetical protein
MQGNYKHNNRKGFIMQDDLDALRRFDDDDIDFGDDDGGFLSDAPVREERRVFGMTAVERMFISIFIFLNVVVLGVGLLLATERIRF